MSDKQTLTAPANPLYALLQAAPNLADIFLGKSTSSGGTTTNSGGTQTTQTQLSPEAINALVKQMLESNSGLAQVSSGQRAAGIYDSSTNSLLTNDLVSRVAGDVAIKSAPTVTTTSPSSTTTSSTVKQAAQIDPIAALLTAGAGIVGKKLLKGIFDSNNGSGDAISAVSDAVANPAAAFSASSLADGAAGLLSSFGGASGDPQISGGAYLASTLLSNGGDIGGFLSGSNPVTDFLYDTFADTGAQAFSGAGLGSAAAVDGLGAIAGPAGALFAVSSLLGGPSVGDVADSVGGLIEGLNPSVICTELHRQGYLTNEVFFLDNLYGKTKVSQDTLRGYHFWAIPLTRQMKKSKVITAIVALFAKSWALEMSHRIEPTKYKPHYFGKLVCFLGVPGCELLGKYLRESKLCQA